MSLCSSAPPCGASRRGVLLLITVSMLTLFMMLGTAYLVVATRARESARALARRTLTADEARIDHAAMLDNVLLTVIRGTAAGQPVTTGSGTALVPPFESLLADRYGVATITGTFSSAQMYSSAGAGNTGPILTGSFATAPGSVVHPSHLNGRLLTFTGPDHPPTSHRILRASSDGSATDLALTLSNPPGTYQLKASDLPSGQAIINGREFAGSSGNEAWDGFDNENAFLAHVKPNGVSRTTVVRPSYVPGLTGDLADNDNDGVPDGVFLDFGLPSIPISSGTSVRVDASVLVVDLDGRFNVNAHGALANMPVRGGDRPSLYGATALGWTTDAADDLSKLASVPLGSGVGPAEVNATRVLSDAAIMDMTPTDTVQLRSGEEPGASILIGTSTYAGQRPAGSRFSADSNTPRIGATEGRHGGQSASAPSQNGFWTSLTIPVRDSHIARASKAELRRVADVFLQNSPTLNNGVPPVWWLSTSGTAFNWGAAGNNYPLPRSVYTSPPDLHGRMKTLTRPVGRETPGDDSDGDGRITYGIVPRVSYAKPEWSTTSDEITGNPYQTRLRSTGTRGGYIHAPSTAGTSASPMPTNPFTVSELERLLRPYDIDVNQLPPRLAAILGTIGEQMRTRLTSESWDTTAIVDGATDGGATPKGAWALIEKNLTLVSGSSASVLYGSGPLNGVLGGEVARGERFNLNRPLTGSKPATYVATDDYYVQRQAYFKDLYTLLILLASPTDRDRLTSSQGTYDAEFQREVAQWSANVVEFRDADSVMTPFEYDTDIFDGWDVDGSFDPDGDGSTTDAAAGDSDRAVVFGVERPEAIITHTLSWESSAGGETMIGVHRPWHSYAHATGSITIPAEPIDPTLDSDDPAHTKPQNLLDLGRKSGAVSYPIWRLRIVTTGTSYVRFDTDTAGNDEFASSEVTGPANTPKLGSDSWLFVQSDSNALYDGSSPWLTLPPVTPTIQILPIDQGGPGGLFKPPGLMEVSDGIAADGKPNWPKPRSGKVYLERLADPESTPTSATWTADPKTTTDLVRYVVVDQAPLQIIRRSPETGKTAGDYNAESVASHRIPRLLLRQTKGETAFWKTETLDPDPPASYDHLALQAWSDGTRGEVLTVPFLEENETDIDVAWMPWPNRPFVSPSELLLVPKHSAIGLLENYRLPLAKKPDAALNPPITLADGDPQATDLPRTVLISGTAWPIFDAVTVPTLFAAIHDSWFDNTGQLATHTGIYRETCPVNQLSSYREPGRVNLNTVTNEQVWDAVVSGPLPSGAVVSGTAALANLATDPFKNMRAALALGKGGVHDPLRLDSNNTFTVSGTATLNAVRNPAHRLYTASRLANVATTRSNVFAIWVTLRQQIPGDADSVQYHRAFYIVDRSIPVGFELGRDHNVRDTVLLRRVIE